MEPSGATEWLALAVLAAFISYSLLSRSINSSVLTLPILFAAFGLLLSGPLNNSIDPVYLDDGKRALAEITLVLVLFSDASRVRFAQLRRSWLLPARMLVIGMPLTIALGTATVYLLNPGAGLAMALLTAAVLTPTDAALGQQVVTSPAVPGHLSRSINVESGLNDGLALPFVLLGATLASTGAQGTEGLAANALSQVILGPLAGIATGWGVAKAMNMARKHQLMQEAASGVVFLCSAFAAYVLAEIAGGNGFIAAFTAGMVFGNTYRHGTMFIHEFMEGAGQLLTMSAFLMFGAFLLPAGLAHATLQAVIIALLFLTVVRVLPVVLSLAGTGLAMREKLFLGWFGPRGLASVLFTLIMIESFDFAYEEELLACVSITVALSVLLHGLTAEPLAKRIGRQPKT